METHINFQFLNISNYFSIISNQILFLCYICLIKYIWELLVVELVWAWKVCDEFEISLIAILAVTGGRMCLQ
jgi:hypothetical protein